MRKIFTLCLGMVLLCSCGNNLDTDTALELLKNNNVEFLCKASIIYYEIDYRSDPSILSYDSDVSKLERLGLVNVERRGLRNPEKVKISITYTDLAKQKYGAGRGKVGIYQFVPTKVVGVSYIDDNKAEVLFRGNMEPTVFHPILREKGQCKSEKDVERKALFKYYDGEGWRFEERIY